MYNGDQYRLMLDKSSFGNRLMKWAGQHFTPDQKQNIGAGREYGYSMMRKCLAQVGEQYTKIKCRPIDKVIYLEDVIIFEGIGTYEYHPFAALAFLSLLYGVMLTDDNHKPHHEIPKKAGQLMLFLNEFWPEEAKEIRNIVLYNDINEPEKKLDPMFLVEEIECSLHPDAHKAIVEKFGKKEVHVHVHGDVNIDKNFGSITDNHDGGIIYE